MPMRLNDVLQITVFGVAQGQAVENVFHYVPEGTVDPLATGVDVWLDDFRGIWRGAVLPHLAPDYTVAEYKAIVIRGTKDGPPVNPNNPDGPKKKVYDYGSVEKLTGEGTPDTGSAVGTPLPTYVAATLQKLTGESGRSNHGSARIATLIEAFTDATDANKLTVAGSNAMALVAAAILGQINGLAGEILHPVVFSRKRLFGKAGNTNNTTDTWTLITSVTVNDLVGSQVSRKQRFRLGL